MRHILTVRCSAVARRVRRSSLLYKSDDIRAVSDERAAPVARRMTSQVRANVHATIHRASQHGPNVGSFVDLRKLRLWHLNAPWRRV